MNILLIEDDAELAAMLRDYLEGEGFSVGIAADGERGVAAALTRAGVSGGTTRGR